MTAPMTAATGMGMMIPATRQAAPAMPQQPVKLLLSIPEAAAQLSLGQTVVWKLISTGQLASVKVGRSRRVPWTALEAFVASLSGAA